MKILFAALLAIVLVFLGARVFLFWQEELQLGQTLSDTEARLQKAEADEANLSAEVQYLEDPANLEKELRSQFNYKKPGETMIIIVPQQTSTASSSRP